MKRMAWVLLGMALVFAASEVRVIRSPDFSPSGSQARARTSADAVFSSAWVATSS